MGDFFTLADWVAALLFAGALAMMALSEKDLKIAAVLIWIALVVTIVRWGLWAFLTDANWIVRGIVGATLGGFLFAGVPAALQWITNKTSDTRDNDIRARSTAIASPEIGSLAYVTTALKLGHSKSRNEWQGHVEVSVINNTDKIIYFVAHTSGDINGVTFSDIDISFDSFIAAKSVISLVSPTIVGFKINADDPYAKPVVVANYKYMLVYKYVEEETFTRTTGRTIRIEYRSDLPEDRPVGSKITDQTTVFFVSQIEE